MKTITSGVAIPSLENKVLQKSRAEINNASNNKKLLGLFIVSVISILVYQFIEVDMNYFDYAMKIRTPKLLSMTMAAVAIGVASIIFQTIINNTIVTPCLLGMNSLYILIHTVIIFFAGSTSVFASNKNLSFVVNVVLMGICATYIYTYLFRKTKYNILYVLLTGTILATFFGSISSALMRIMDPNEFASLQDKIIPSFSSVNGDIISIAFMLMAIVLILFRKDIKLLDVIALGKNQSINLGVDYDKTISRLLLVVTMLISIATAMIGPISFLGLIIANISRQLFSTYKHTYLMAGSALVGVIILVMGQAVIEHVFTYSTTIAVFINIFGGLYFMFLIMKNSKSS